MPCMLYRRLQFNNYKSISHVYLSVLFGTLNNNQLLESDFYPNLIYILPAI